MIPPLYDNTVIPPLYDNTVIPPLYDNTVIPPLYDNTVILFLKFFDNFYCNGSRIWSMMLNVSNFAIGNKDNSIINLKLIL